MNLYGVDCNAIPNCLPVPLLARVASYHDALHKPIDECENVYRSTITDEHSMSLVCPQLGLLSICVRNNNELCISATFCNESAEPTTDKNKAKLVYQFLAGIDNKGLVYVKRVTEAEAKTQDLCVLTNDDSKKRVSAISSCDATQLNPLISVLKSAILAQKRKRSGMHIVHVPQLHSLASQ